MLKKWYSVSLIIVIILFLMSCSGQVEQPNKLLKHAEFSEKDYVTLVTPNNELGFDMLESINPDQDGNIVISPTSLLMALSMIYHGSEGTTKDEIASLLHVNGIKDTDLLSANAALLNKLYRESQSINLSIANSLWLNQQFEFQDDFEKNNRHYFTAEISDIDVNDIAAADRINEWVAEKTNDKIDEIIQSPLADNLVTLLINALYFKGVWTYEFDENLTNNESFYSNDGKEQDVAMMMLTEKLAYQENDLFQAVKLPYGEGEMNMQIYLPREELSLSDIRQFFNETEWSSLQKGFKEIEGTIKMPKFELEFESHLNDPLEKMGMIEAFQDGKANFPHMIKNNEQLKIDEVKQTTFIEVNEQGTEAAAITSVEIVTMSAPANLETFYMEVNRPFLFTITDEETGVNLFIGMIENP